jgi:hypothetical protein
MNALTPSNRHSRNTTSTSNVHHCTVITATQLEAQFKRGKGGSKREKEGREKERERKQRQDGKSEALQRSTQHFSTSLASRQHGLRASVACKPCDALDATQCVTIDSHPQPILNRPSTDPQPTLNRPSTDPQPILNRSSTDPQPILNDPHRFSPVLNDPHRFSSFQRSSPVLTGSHRFSKRMHAF